jgi:aminoglycoside phosphotransferase (APT) family kinase protein
MNNSWLESIPEDLRDRAREALASTLGSSPLTFIEPISGGASGALAYRIEMNGRSYLLRMETRRSPLRNPHQYVCMRTAAEAGIAPPLRHADDGAGVAILDFLIQRPLRDYPGGPTGLADALGKLLARLHATAPFPILGDYRVFLDRTLGYLRKVFAPGLLDPHAEAFGRIRQAYPWDASTHTSSHNDPNPRNILFDGERLWLIDWETAYRNDPLTDVAILTENHAATPELEQVLLQSWLGRPPDRALRARVLLMRQLTRLYYAGLLMISSGTAPATIMDLSAPSPAEFRSLIASGQMKAAATETMVALGKMMLASFLAGVSAPDFEQALATAETG